jgi:hypothetical protein
MSAYFLDVLRALPRCRSQSPPYNYISLGSYGKFIEAPFIEIFMNFYVIII